MRAKAHAEAVLVAKVIYWLMNPSSDITGVVKGKGFLVRKKIPDLEKSRGFLVLKSIAERNYYSLTTETGTIRVPLGDGKYKRIPYTAICAHPTLFETAAG